MPKRCIAGLGDPAPLWSFVWSRSSSEHDAALKISGAFLIAEGLTVASAPDSVIPICRYKRVPRHHPGLNPRDNIWDFAPNAAITYTTPPNPRRGDRNDANSNCNNYLTNRATEHYSTGTLLNLHLA